MFITGVPIVFLQLDSASGDFCIRRILPAALIAWCVCAVGCVIGAAIYCLFSTSVAGADLPRGVAVGVVDFGYAEVSVSCVTYSY